MHAFIEKREQAQSRTASGIQRPSLSNGIPSAQANAMLQLQRQIGNKRVQRLLQGKADDRDEPSITGRPAPLHRERQARSDEVNLKCAQCEEADEIRRAPSGPRATYQGPNPEIRAHEAEPVVRRRAGNSNEVIDRACLSGTVCAATPGSASGFGTDVETREAKARARRAAMSPARQKSTGHAGPARQMEIFFDTNVPGLRANIHGIFIDQDMDPNVAASTQDCASMAPPIAGATKPCVFVPAHVNQEALTFNTKASATTIGGRSREDWRIETIQTLTHEIQHVLYENKFTGTAAPGGVASCNRADVQSELSEMNAIMSEFPSVFDAVPAGAPSTDPAAVRLTKWFQINITNKQESVRGTVTTLRCKCSCADSDAFIKETFNFVSGAWTVEQKNAFNAELRQPVWGLSWPL